MKAALTPSTPNAFAGLAERLNHWRNTRCRAQPIPEELWSAATALARDHGLASTATALKLNYYDLQRRLQPNRKGKPSLPTAKPDPGKVELTHATAPPPPEAGQEKYAPSVGVTVALLRYGSGMPHYRLARLQESLGVPCPESTQWEVMKPLFEQAQPILDHLITQTANGPLFHNDDTKMRILDLRKPGSATAAKIDPKRKGTFTANILGQVGPYTVALYFSGWQHAGENLEEVLKRRSADLEAPIQMCDALSRNTGPNFESILCHCLSHARGEFVPIAGHFPQECRHVLDSLGAVYHVDTHTVVRFLR